MLTRRHIIAGLGSCVVAAAVSGHDALADPLRQYPVLKEFLPIRIAIPEFVPGAAVDQETATGIAHIIADDLKRSGQFTPLNPASFAEHIVDFGKVPQFADWKPLDELVTGQVTHQDDGRLKVEFRLWNVSSGLQLTGQQYVTSPDQWRRIAHIISDQIYTRPTGEKGYFDSRVVFVEQSGPAAQRIRRLAMVDQDGGNPRYLTPDTEIVAQPRFVPQSQTICYTLFGQSGPQVCLYEIETGRREIIDQLPGAPLCSPGFSPDGKRLVMSLVQGDRANLFTMDLDSKQTSRLTDLAAADTAPWFSPDGQQICFESDRSGKPQIYVMPAGGGEAQRISFAGGTSSAPVWSPRGDAIAFTKQDGGRSELGLIKPDGSGERSLTSGARNANSRIESPTFAPNGRVLMFVRDPGGDAGPSLYTIDISGRNELKVPTQGYASDPAWSPLLT